MRNINEDCIDASIWPLLTSYREGFSWYMRVHMGCSHTGRLVLFAANCTRKRSFSSMCPIVDS